MPGIKCLYITSDGRVFNVAISKNSVFKPVPDLAGESILEVSIFYETKERKPWRIFRFDFERITLNSEGQFILTGNEVHRSMRNFNIFAFSTVEDISQRSGPLPIPNAPIIPNEIEKKALISYLKGKYSVLWENSWNVLEQHIRDAHQRHENQIKTIKKASILRNHKTSQ
ncbi:MAG: hypothetical protein ACYC3E_01200 [Carboxydocellales bacterium]